MVLTNVGIVGRSAAIHIRIVDEQRGHGSQRIFVVLLVADLNAVWNGVGARIQCIGKCVCDLKIARRGGIKGQRFIERQSILTSVRRQRFCF